MEKLYRQVSTALEFSYQMFMLQVHGGLAAELPPEAIEILSNSTIPESLFPVLKGLGINPKNMSDLLKAQVMLVLRKVCIAKAG